MLRIRFVTAIAWIVVTCAAALGADITGVVKDSSGAAIPGVAVEWRSEAAGQSGSVVTGPGGEFRIPGLLPGRYAVRVARTGFEAYSTTIDLADGTSPLNIELHPAGPAEEVKVRGKRSPLANSDPVYRELRDAVPIRTYAAENLTFTRDAGKFMLRDGNLTFTQPVKGHVTFGVFSGNGEFILETPLASERRYLNNLTGAESVREQFKRAVFCFTDQTFEELTRGRQPAEADSKAAGVLRDFRRRARHSAEVPRSQLEAMLGSDSVENLEAEMVADLYAPGPDGFFEASLYGGRHDGLRFSLKPRGALPQLPAPEEVALVYLDPQGEQEGIWYLAHRLPEYQAGAARSGEEKRVVRAEAFRIETVLGKNDHLAAVEEVTLSAVAPVRVISFDLLPSLRVSRVSLAGGAELPFIQEDRRQDGSFYVILPQLLAKGASSRLTIEYEGDKVVQKAGGGNFSVDARTNWYPNVNTFLDRAKYDLTFKVPKDLTLVGVGNPVKEWKEDRFACSQWVSEVPLAVAGFNYGSFKKKEVHDEPTGYTLDGYAAGEMPDYLKMSEATSHTTPSRLTERALTDAQNAMRIFTAWFGPAPYGRLSITQQPEFSFGQSWPTLVYLPMSAFLDATQRWQLLSRIDRSLNAFVQEVTPHEVSHQWWGHMVGWRSFHDQWLSEGFADFSAGLYLHIIEKTPDAYLKYLERSRDLIVEKNQFGRSPADAGSVWDGLRLNTYRTPGAYSRLVYPKGGYILHMLRWLMYDPAGGHQQFIDMMQDFVRSHLNRNATTEDFQATVEKHMQRGMDLDHNGKMDWFFREWVFGTAIPRYQLESQVTAAEGGKWLLSGRIVQSDVPEDFKMPVPVYGDFDGHPILIGRVRVIGTRPGEFRVLLPRKPKRVVLNAFHDVLERK